MLQFSYVTQVLNKTISYKQVTIGNHGNTKNCHVSYQPVMTEEVELGTLVKELRDEVICSVG